MSSPRPAILRRDSSTEEFEFLDAQGDLDVDLSKSPILGGEKAVDKLNSGISLVLSALCAVVEEQGFQVTIPVTAMATTAVGALAGSLIGGPSGFAIGLITGAVMAYRTSPARTKSPKNPDPKKMTIRQVFSQMTFQQKKELMKDLLGCLKESNVRKLVIEIAKNEEIRSTAMKILSQFLMKKLGICLVKAK